MRTIKGWVCTLLLALTVTALTAQNEGLLFHLSGDNGFTADYAAGKREPNFNRNVETIADGAVGTGLHCLEGQVLSYWAHENMRARRGTLSFWWRASWPFTQTEFPIFRAGYSDHSSWDMAFLRIDYNGHGFDAFVTDVNLARVRTSVTVDPLPAPDRWTHFAFSWDETQGVRLYLNGKLVSSKDSIVVLDASLDQFGPHSRIISPYQVQSAYNYQRGGDIDEIRIYDQALDASQVAALAAKQTPQVAAFRSDLSQPAHAAEWLLRYGWNRPGDLPPCLDAAQTTVRKVQILEPYDLKRWWWKANDGIRETTWPGVYNRSRIVGRNDYFQLPDWDCYSLSGQQVSFVMPQEEWNHIEFSGGADGRIALSKEAARAPRDGFVESLDPLWERAGGNERTFHRLPRAMRGGEVVFTNNVQETPIGEFDAYYVHAADAPQGIVRQGYRFARADEPGAPGMEAIWEWIRGRNPADERALLLASPVRLPGDRGGDREYRNIVAPRPLSPTTMPLAHLLIPADGWQNLHGGLDGIRVQLPALDVQPLVGGLFPLNVRVMDPAWPLRKMLDFSFSVHPNEPRVLYLDLRDRMLPNDAPLYLTLAGAPGFRPEMLEGMQIELVFKAWDEAKAEHVADRFTQVRDNYAMIVEEHPRSSRLNKYNQLKIDLTELLRVEPDHRHGREYNYIYHPRQPRPEVTIAPAKSGVPLWAHLQLEYLKQFRYWAEWVIDNRQISNGEFGGGLSDDSDFGNWLPPLWLMGVMPDKIDASLSAMMEAVYANGMLDRGMSAIQSDGLHTFEEGVNVIGQINLIRVGEQKQIDRLREAAQSVQDQIIGVDKNGHTHFRSDYFSRTKIADSGVWAWSSERQSLHMIPALYLGSIYGDTLARRQVIDLADGFLAHATTTPDGRVVVQSQINFETDQTRLSGPGNSAPLFWAAWRWTGDEKYLAPLGGREGSVPGNMVDLPGKPELERIYTHLISEAAIREYSNTLGYVWTDRMVFDIVDIQRARLGGVAQTRSMFYPGNLVGWRFDREDAAEQVAILFPHATPEAFDIELFNTSDAPVEARMTGWDVEPGTWELVQDGKARRVSFARGQELALRLPPMRPTIVRMRRAGPK